MAKSNGIIVDVGFKPDIKNFVNELDSTFKNIDYNQYIGLSEAFEKQEKEIKGKIQELKNLLATDWGKGQIDEVNKQVIELKSSMSEISKLINVLIKSAPSDMQSRFGEQLNAMSKDAGELSTVLENARDSIDMVNSATNNTDSQNTVRALTNEYKELQVILEGIEKLNNGIKNKDGNFKYSSKDEVKLMNELAAAYENFRAAYKEFDKVDEDAPDYTSKVEAYAKAADELNRYANVYENLGFDMAESIELNDDFIPVKEAKEEAAEALTSLSDVIKEKFLEVRTELESYGVNIAKVFSESVASSEELKLTVPLDISTSTSDLEEKALEIIKTVQSSLQAQPLEIEVQLISDYGKYNNTKALKSLQQDLNELNKLETSSLDTTEIKRKIEDTIETLNKRLEDSLAFNVSINSKDAETQLTSFISRMEEQLKVLSKDLNITPNLQITDDAKAELQNQINNLVGEGISIDIVGTSGKESSQKQTGYLEALREKLSAINALVKNISNNYELQANSAYNAAGRTAEALKNISDPLYTIENSLSEIIKLYKEFANLNSTDSKKASQEGMSKAIETLLAETKRALILVNAAFEEGFGSSIAIPADVKERISSSIKEIAVDIDAMFDNSTVDSWSNNFISNLDKISNKIQTLFGSGSLIETLKNWTSSDKNMISQNGMSSLRERSGILGSNGKFYGSYDIGEGFSTNMMYSAIKEAVADGVKASIGVHSHPENISTMSLIQKGSDGSINGDLAAFYQQYIEDIYGNIQTQIIRSLKETEVFDAKGFFDSNKSIDFGSSEIEEAILKKVQEYKEIIGTDLLESFNDLVNPSSKQISKLFSSMLQDVEGTEFEKYLKNALDNAGGATNLWKKVSEEFASRNYSTMSQALYSVIASFTDGMSGNDIAAEFSGTMANPVSAALEETIPNIKQILKDYLQAGLKKYSSQILDEALKGTGYKNNFSDFIKTYTNEEFDTNNPLGLSSSALDSIFDTSSADNFLNTLTKISEELENISTLIKNTDFSNLFKVEIDEESLTKLAETLSGISVSIGNLDTESLSKIPQQESALTSIVGQASEIDKIIKAIDEKNEAFKQEETLVSSASDAEVQKLDGVRREVELITTAVKNKTKEFTNEQTIVEQVAQAEVKSLTEVKTAIDSISSSAKGQTDAFDESRLKSSFENYSEYIKNNDASSEAGLKAALEYFNAFKEALYAKMSKVDLKKYLVSGINFGDLFSTVGGNYSNYKAGNASLDLTGINKQIEDTRQELAKLTSPDISQGLRDISDALTNLINSGANPDNLINFLTQVNRLISTLGGKNGGSKISAVTQNLEGLSKAFDKIQTTKTSPVLAQVSNLVSNSKNLSALASILKTVNSSGTSKGVNSFANFNKDFSSIWTSMKKGLSGDSLGVNDAITSLNALNKKWQETPIQFSQSKVSQDALNTVLKYFDALESELDRYSKNLMETASKKNVSGEVVEDVKKAQAELTTLQSIIDKIKNGGILSSADLSSIERISGYVANVNKELSDTSSKLAKTSTVEKMLQRIAKTLNTDSAASSELKNRLKAVSEELESMGQNVPIDEFTRLSNEAFTLFRQIEQAGGASKNIFSKISESFTHQFASLVAQYLSFYDIIRYAREAYQTIESLDTALVDLKKTTTMTNSELNEFYYEANDIAKQMGVTTEEIINQASAWSRLGYSSKEASETMAKLSSQFASISPGMDVDTATTGLVSVMKAFDFETEDVLDGIMSKINSVGNNFATNNEEIVEGLQNSASSIAAVGGTLEDAISLFTGAQEIIQDASKVGNALRTITMRIRGYDEETEELSDDLVNISGTVVDLTKTAAHPEGISLFTDSTQQHYKSMVEYLREISGIWDELEEKTQTELLQQLFGKTRANVGAAIITNFDAVEKSLTVMENSAGSADEEMSIITESIEYKVNELQETVVGMVQEFVSSDLIKNIVDTGTTILNLIDSIVDKSNALPAVITAISAAMGATGKGLIKSSDLSFGSKTSGIDMSAAVDVINNYNLALKNGKISQAEFNAVVKDADLAVGSYLQSIKGSTAYESALNTFMLGSVTGIKNVNAAIKEYNNISSENVEEQNAQIKVIQQTNSALADYLKGLNKGAQASLPGYIAKLVATKAATIALNIATGLLNAAIGMLVSYIASKAITAIDNYIHRSEKLIEASEEAADTISSIQSDFKTTQETVEELGTKFAELAQGVDTLSGKNLFLSDDDYKEFLNISNQLADIFPQLSRNYTENGDAIVQLSGDVDSITDALNRLVEQGKVLANQKIADELPTIFDGISEQSNIIEDQVTELKKTRDALRTAFDVFSSDGITLSNTDVGALWDSYYEALDVLIEYKVLWEEDWQYDQDGKPVAINIKVDENSIEGSKEQVEAALHDLQGDIADQLNQVENDIAAAQNEKNSLWNGLLQSLDAWLYTDSTFQALPDDLRAYVQNVVNNLDFDSLDFENTDKLKDYIQRYILGDFAQDGNLKQQLTVALDAQTAFNSNQVSFKEYQADLAELFDILNSSDLDAETIKAVKVLFGYEFDEDGTSEIPEINRLAVRVAEKVQDEVKTQIGDLPLEDLKIADELEVPDGVKLSWEELKQKIEECKQVVESTKIAPTFDPTAFSDSMSKLASLRSEWENFQSNLNDGDASTPITFKIQDVEALRDSLQEVTETAEDAEKQAGVTKEQFDEFQRVLTDTSSTADDITDAFNTVLTQWANATLAADDYSAEVQTMVASQLEMNGVTAESAQAFVEFQTTVDQVGKELEAMDGDIDENVMSMLNEAETSEIAKLALAQYVVEKWAANGIDISTDAAIDSLMAEAAALNLDISLLQEYKRLKGQADAYTTYINNTSIDKRDPALEASLKAGYDEFNNFDSEEYAAQIATDWQEQVQDQIEKVHLDFSPVASNSSGSASGAGEDLGEDLAEGFKSGLESGLSDIESIIDAVISKIEDKISDLNDEMDAALDALDAQCDAAVAALEAERDAAIAAIEAEIKAIEDQIEAKEEEIEAINKASEARAREIELQQKQYQLARAQNQRSVLLNKYGRTCGNTRVA